MSDRPPQNRSTRHVVSRIDANVIDEHGGRGDCRVIGILRPAAADREVEKDVERMVIDPLCTGGDVLWGLCLIKHIIYVKTNYVGLPFNGKNMEVVSKRASARKNVRRGQGVRSGVARTMHAAMNPGGVMTKVFHDVDFAALRPAI